MAAAKSKPKAGAKTKGKIDGASNAAPTSGSYSRATGRAQAAASRLADTRREVARAGRAYADVVDREADNVDRCTTSNTPWCVSEAYEVERLQVALDVVRVNADFNAAREAERQAYLGFLEAVTAAAIAAGDTNKQWRSR